MFVLDIIVLCILYLKGIDTETYTEEQNLLLVRAGTNASVEDVWETTGGLNDSDGNGHHQNTHQRRFDDYNFRSKLVDAWNETNYPESVSVVIHNKYGDELCSMDFDTPNTNWFSDSWFVESALSRWNYKLPADAKFQKGRPFFDLYVSDNNDDDKAWIAIALWNSSFVNLTNHSPMFLCSTSHDLPHTLMKEIIVTVPPVTTTASDCYPWYNTAATLAFTDVTAMTVEACVTECVTLNKAYAFLESGTKCNCGTIIGDPIDSPGHCGGSCVGDTSQVCGTTDGFYIPYATGGGSGSQTTSGSSSESYDGVPGPTMSTVLFTSKTNTILAGDLNTTVDLPSGTSGSLLYIRAVELLYKDNTNTPVTSTYSVLYQLHPEGGHRWSSTSDQHSHPKFYPTDGARVDLDVLPAWNLTFVFSSTPANGVAVINIYTIGADDFLIGTMLSIISFKSIDVTTTTAQDTTSTSTAAESTTSETATTAETTTMEIIIPAETTTIENTTPAETTTTGNTNPYETTTTENTTPDETTTIENTTPAETTTIENTTPTETTMENTTPAETTTTENTTPDETTTPDVTTQAEITTTTSELTTTLIETSTSGTTTSMQETTTMSVTTAVSDDITTSESITTITNLDETTAVVTTTETTTSLTTGQTANVSASMCLCTCVNTNFNLTEKQLDEAIQELKKSLTVSKTELSSYKRKLISAPDSRQSAASIGYVGVLVIAFVFGSVLFCDGISLHQALAKRMKKC